MEIDRVCKECGINFKADPWADDLDACLACREKQTESTDEAVDVAEVEIISVKSGATISKPAGESPAGQARPAADNPPPSPTDNKISQYLEKSQQVIEEFRRTDFKEELLPMDAGGASALLKDMPFWAVLALGVLPLFINSLQDPTLRLNGLIFFFALVWGGIFKAIVIKSRAGIFFPASAFLFTGIIGLFLLLTFYKILPKFYLDMVYSASAGVRLFGFILQVGLWEELCKLAPVFLYLAYKKKTASMETALLIGVFSGLGFAAFENVHYSQLAAESTIQTAVAYGDRFRSLDAALFGAAQGTIAAMSNAMLRSLSLVFAHAIFSGIASCFLVISFIHEKRRVVFIFLSLAVSAILHGSYDWLCGVQEAFAAGVIAITFILFYGYLAKMRRYVAKSEAPHPGEESACAAGSP
jgi:RsiW-degrading membrane proteinase PrsW (M82 family)